ncbi:MAG: HEPN domain-containing protein [Fimbriimonadales bacterium]|nr:HEPN domain-containing protein [Fimbriimonadales bacterium]
MEEREAIIQYRIERAYEALNEAQLLVDHNHYAAAANRLYYACFYAAQALLLRQGMSASRHSGIIALFNQHFLKTKIVDVEVGKTLNRLLDLRNRGDYEPLAQFEREEILMFSEQARAFVDTVTALARRSSTS